MEHTDDLLGDRTRAADRTSGVQVLPEGVQPALANPRPYARKSACLRQQ